MATAHVPVVDKVLALEEQVIGHVSGGLRAQRDELTRLFGRLSEMTTSMSAEMTSATSMGQHLSQYVEAQYQVMGTSMTDFQALYSSRPNAVDAPDAVDLSHPIAADAARDEAGAEFIPATAQVEHATA